MSRYFRFLALVVLAPTLNMIAGERKPLERTDTPKAGVRFSCNTGYTLEVCKAQVAILRSALAPYHPEILGSWTWVLVRSEDWKPILRRVGRDPDSPAFSILEKRQTFLEEALLVSIASRRAELLRKWGVPLDEFLDFAITHELAHAYCNETDERRTEENARRIRQERHLSCDGHNLESARQRR